MQRRSACQSAPLFRAHEPTDRSAIVIATRTPRGDFRTMHRALHLAWNDVEGAVSRRGGNHDAKPITLYRLARRLFVGFRKSVIRRRCLDASSPSDA